MSQHNITQDDGTDLCNNANLPYDEIDINAIRPNPQADPWGRHVVHYTSSEDTWEDLGMRIVSTAPSVPGSVNIPHLNPLELEVCVEFEKPLRLQEIDVYVWTNLYHADNPEGGWGRLPLPYVSGSRAWDDDGSTRYTFRRTVHPADLGGYGLMFCVQRHKSCVWASRERDALRLTVVACDEELSPWLQGGDATQITKFISIGNTQAVSSKDSNFKSVIYLDTKDLPRQVTGGKDIHAFPLPEGASHEIPASVISDIILKLKEFTTQGEPILMADKLGQGRVGSLIVAYIYANNPCLSFNEAYEFVSARRQIYTHKGLTNTLTQLYPRD